MGIVLGAPKGYRPPPEVVVEGPEDRGTLEVGDSTLTFRGGKGKVQLKTIEGIRTFEDPHGRTWVVAVHAGETDSPFYGPAALFAAEAEPGQQQELAAALEAARAAGAASPPERRSFLRRFGRSA